MYESAVSFSILAKFQINIAYEKGYYTFAKIGKYVFRVVSLTCLKFSSLFC